MSKKYSKTITREIRSSFGRFAAIIAIVALGVGFLVGILSSTPDMKATADKYYADYSMSDFDLKSTMGFTPKDIKAISDIKEVETVMPARVTDALVSINNETVTAGRILGLNMNNITVNRLELKDGRMPETSKECVIEKPSNSMEDVSIGDTIIISDENEDADNTYKQKKFKVVGIVDSPYYFCSNKEPASVGTGRTGVILYTWQDAYDMDIYTDMFVLTSYNGGAFSDEYDDYIERVTEKIEAVSDKRIPARHKEIIDDAMDEVQEAKNTLASERTDAEKELSDAEKELAEGQKEYDNGVAELNAAKKQLNDGRVQIQSARDEITSGRSELAAAQADLDSAKAELDKSEKELLSGKAELDTAKVELDANKESIESARSELAAGAALPPEVIQQIEMYDQAAAQWEAGMAEWQAGMNAWEKGYSQWEAGIKTVKNNSAKLNKAESQLKASEKQLNESEALISENEAVLADALNELTDGRRELAEGRAKANAEFADAESEIAEAEDEIADIEAPEWYILDRNSNLSYAKYSIDVEKVAAIATVFPIFFFLVAALVSLTTMTRMIEEERIQIGTLKALGYRRRTIASKYLIYCGIATVIGCFIGLSVGFKVLPTVIAMAFASQYDLPSLITEFNVNYAILSCGLEILCTLGATWLACRHTLAEKPSALMVPRAPKAGKRILLERVSFIWNKLSFTHKATARNVFRYKKHLFMTVIGIAGCTALIVAGFGIKDSLNALVNTQFDDILKYDMRIELTEDKSDKVLDDFLKDKDALSLSTSTVDIKSESNKEQISSTLYVPEDSDKLKDFVVLRDRKTHETVPFDDDSVIITEKMADVLEVSPGDTITVVDPDGVPAEFELTGITENYAGCYAYIASDVYSAKVDSVEYNCYLLDSGITGQQAQDAATSLLLDSEYVSSTEFTSQSRETYQIILDSLEFLVYVLVIFAGLLAVVVLYNLTNININERIRELATLRVLGYHYREVAMYIFREIGILTILGTIAGLILGKILHYYVIIIAESTDMVFGRQLEPMTYILAAAFTLLFSLLVDLLMLRKLRNIDMTASMKAVD